jgi:glutamate-1-semialdehyde 2,1-aminomutase
MTNRQTNEQLLESAQTIIPGGVNSPVRAFGSVGGAPVFMARAKGACLYDQNDRAYIDYVGSWGPAILGHAPAPVTKALQGATAKGTSFGTATSAEIDLAQKVLQLMPNLEMLRLVCSGTEATMTALRLARAATGRDKLIKFSGCYHGHADSFLVKAGSGAMTLGVPNSPGVTASTAGDTLTAEYNNLDSVKQLIEQYPDQIAALIVEPVVGNAGLIPPDEGFLTGLREITEQHEICLIFDEVMTGFRLAPGGAQQLYGISPDLTTLGKIIGAGCPIGAIGGKRKMMNQLAPAGPVYQAGTLSGNPLAVAAGLAQLNQLNEGLYQTLEQRGTQLETGIRENLKKLSLPYQYQRVGSMSCLFFTDHPVRNFDDAVGCDTKRFARYFHAMLDQNIYLPPSQFEANFISGAHSKKDIDKTVAANYKALSVLNH